MVMESNFWDLCTTFPNNIAIGNIIGFYPIYLLAHFENPIYLLAIFENPIFLLIPTNILNIEKNSNINILVGIGKKSNMTKYWMIFFKISVRIRKEIPAFFFKSLLSKYIKHLTYVI